MKIYSKCYWNNYDNMMSIIVHMESATLFFPEQILLIRY